MITISPPSVRIGKHSTPAAWVSGASARYPSAVDKFEDRRAELAEAALATLAELGYARTSLREIAANSEFSHGVLHDYFADKFELIMFCVRQYKAQCVTRYDEIVTSATTARGLALGFAAGMAATMAATMRDDGALHRLWYDLRSQSLFEPSFQTDVAAIDQSLERMIWRIVTAYAALTGAEPRVSPALASALFDGVFQQGLRRHLHGAPAAMAELAAHVEQTLWTVRRADAQHAGLDGVCVCDQRTQTERTSWGRGSGRGAIGLPVPVRHRVVNDQRVRERDVIGEPRVHQRV